MGKSAFIKLVALFISVTLIGFFIGFNYSLKTSREYGLKPSEVSSVMQNNKPSTK